MYEKSWRKFSPSFLLFFLIKLTYKQYVGMYVLKVHVTSGLIIIRKRTLELFLRIQNEMSLDEIPKEKNS